MKQREYIKTLSIATAANETEFKFEDKSVVEDRRVVGLWVRTGGKARNGADLINEDVFNSSFLDLYENETKVVAGLPLANIKKANDNGEAFELNFGKIDIHESVVFISNEAAIVPGEMIEIQFHYLKERNGRQ
jgi:hypothetical protein